LTYIHFKGFALSQEEKTAGGYTVKKSGFMRLQRDINPFSVFEIPNKRENRLLSALYTKKKVYAPLQILKPFFRLLSNQKRFFRFLFSGSFLQCTPLEIMATIFDH
jgi:hypothetical protein